MRQSRKPLKGQVSLIGEVFQNSVKYQPHVSSDPNTGLSVVVLRLPPTATQLERLEAHNEALRMSGATKISDQQLKKEFWLKHHRDKRVIQMIKEAREREKN